MNEIIHSTWFGISGYVLGILGLILSFVFFKRSKIEKRPCGKNRSNNLIYGPTNKLKDLKITVRFKGTNIDTLSYTKVGFWNAGKATINIADLSGLDPLRIEVEKEVIVYDCEIIYASQKSNNFSIDWKNDDNVVYIYFDYIDFNQGLIVKILHSGNGDSYKSDAVNIKGAIKGATKIEIPSPTFPPSSFLSDSKIFYEDNLLI